MKLIQLYSQVLQEIGEGSSKPFEYTIEKDTPNLSKYIIDGETSKGEKEPIRLFLMYTEFSDFGIEYLLKNPERTGYDEEFVDLVKKHKEKFTDGLNMVTIIFERVGDNKGAFDDVNDTQFMFRLMATLKEILMGVIKQRNINVLDFNPSESSNKGDFGMGRYRLYKLFIKKAFPNAIEVADQERIFFILQ